MTATTANFAAILKTVWSDGLEVPLFSDAPAWALCPKTTDWTGDPYVCDIDVGGLNGISSTFSAAKARKGASKPQKFSIPSADRYVLWGVEHKLMALSSDDKGAVVEAVGYESKKALERMGATMGHLIHSNGGGSVGQIAAGGITGATITLTDAQQIKNFELGDAFYLSAGDGSGGADTLKVGGPLTVLSVDIDSAGLGKVTFTAGVTATIATAAAGDFLFRDGDFKACPTGLEGFNPFAAPTATLFMGMDRTLFPIRQAGIRIDVSAVSGMINKVKACLARGSAFGAKYSHAFLNPDDWNTLDGELQSARRYITEKDQSGKVGFTGIEFMTHGGSPVSIIPDPYVPKSTFRAVNFRGSFGFKSAGQIARFLTMDGQKDMMMEESTNTFEGRLGTYGNFWCKRPIDLLRGKLA